MGGNFGCAIFRAFKRSFKIPRGARAASEEDTIVDRGKIVSSLKNRWPTYHRVRISTPGAP